MPISIATATLYNKGHIKFITPTVFHNMLISDTSTYPKKCEKV